MPDGADRLGNISGTICQDLPASTNSRPRVGPFRNRQTLSAPRKRSASGNSRGSGASARAVTTAAGQSVVGIRAIKPAAEVVYEMVEEAQECFEKMGVAV